jgi:hypothetical protein
VESGRSGGYFVIMPAAIELICALHRRFAENPAKGWPGGEAVAGATGADAEGPSFYNEAGAELARGYSEGRYCFEFCDRLVNTLFQIWVTRQSPRPELFLRVYEAFDAGEYHRRTDKTDDPVADHTDPAIRNIVSSL